MRKQLQLTFIGESIDSMIAKMDSEYIKWENSIMNLLEANQKCLFKFNYLIEHLMKNFQ